MRETKKIIYIILGSLFLVLGAVGIFMPILPTTPFWLLTCWFYLHSSETLYGRVMRNRHFGAYIHGFMVEKAIPLRSKVLSITVMWSSILVTVFGFIDYLWLQILLLLITTAVTFYILSFPTKSKQAL